MRSSLRVTRNHYRPGAWKWLVGIFVAFVGLMVAQQMYYRHRLPEVKAALAEADSEGEAIFEKIGVMPGSTPYDAGEKRYGEGGRNSSWQGTPTAITWQREYETPGTFETITEWYRKRLQGEGWVSIDDTPPSIVQREFKRGKWIVKIGRGGEWPHPTRTRIGLELKWSFRHLD